MSKQELRERFAASPIQGADAVTAALFTWLSSRLPATITTFRALDDEVNVWELVDRLPGWRWLLPRVEEDDSLTWRDARSDLERHRWGMDQPVRTAPLVERHQIDYLLVPGLAFDRSGNRLGRGRGFYDRELGRMRADACSVGVTVESRLVDAIPIEEHDRPVDYLATEVGVRRAIA